MNNSGVVYHATHTGSRSTFSVNEQSMMYYVRMLIVIPFPVCLYISLFCTRTIGCFARVVEHELGTAIYIDLGL